MTKSKIYLAGILVALAILYVIAGTTK